MSRASFHPEARREFDDAIDNFAERSPELARRFLVQTTRTIKVLQAFPEMGSPLGRTSRRFPIRPFQYDLIYLVEADHLYVIALAHHRRRPGYWRDREA